MIIGTFRGDFDLDLDFDFLDDLARFFFFSTQLFLLILTVEAIVIF